MALGASHLSKVSGTDFLQSALVHRGRAITGLQQALFDETCSSADLDSILATCYALAFQTVYLDDGLADFIGMTRGCTLMTNRIVQHNMPSVFSLLPESTEKQQTFQDVPPRPNDTILIRKGVEALEEFEARLSTSTQVAFFNLLISALRELRTSTRAGCAEFQITGQDLSLEYDPFSPAPIERAFTLRVRRVDSSATAVRFLLAD
ncbi:MAG: hypothetical protein M1823_007157, partial [Watsoniomyces obsoletus]